MANSIIISYLLYALASGIFLFYPFNISSAQKKPAAVDELRVSKDSIRLNNSLIKMDTNFKRIIKHIREITKSQLNFIKSLTNDKNYLNKNDTVKNRINADSTASNITVKPQSYPEESYKLKNDFKILLKIHDSCANNLSGKNTRIRIGVIPDLYMSTPVLKIRGGFVSYNTDYRSLIDTPFREKNIIQHNLYGNLDVSVKNVPLKINYLFRRSNGSIFKDINDVQIAFDALQFCNQLRSSIKERLLILPKAFKDSLTYLQLIANSQRLSSMKDWLNSAKVKQQLIEYNQILKIPEIIHDPKLPDSINSIRASRIKEKALSFIEAYNDTANDVIVLTKNVDSLQLMYNKTLEKIRAYGQLLNEIINGVHSVNTIGKALKDAGIKSPVIAIRYRWLLNTRKFGLGRNQLNYSELTSKNMSLTGLNVEYNSWYYFALAVGTVNYPFRDFVINTNRKAQHLLLARIGIGAPESSHLIFSFYKGRKQLFAVTNSSSGTSLISIAGIAAEFQYRINRYSYLLAEAASSVSPDYRKNPITMQKFDFHDQSNKAVSLKWYGYIAKTASKMEALYKFNGINFQSFSSFQPNSTVKSWYIKADQQFFRRELKIAASLRSNEFSNPYITQNYKANTIFKSLQASFRAKGVPSFTIGYIPTSQVNSIDSQLVENKFYSFNGGVSHSYDVGIRKATTSFNYSRFFNNKTDSSLLYYNAINIFFNQSVIFNSFTMNVGYSHSRNTSFALNVIEGGLQFKCLDKSVAGIGIKVNNFNNKVNQTGGFANLLISIKDLGVISVQYDNGFMPGRNQTFIRNETMNINFSRLF